MQHLTMLISPDGRWVVEDSAEFFAALGDSRPDYDATAFAVKNLGFIKFQVHEQSLIEIELHPYTVELPALLAAQQQLLVSKVRRFGAKSDKNFVDPQAAIPSSRKTPCMASCKAW